MHITSPKNCESRLGGIGERKSHVVVIPNGPADRHDSVSFSANALLAADDKTDEEAEDDLPVYAGEEIVVTESKEKVATISSVASKVPVSSAGNAPPVSAWSIAA